MASNAGKTAVNRKRKKTARTVRVSACASAVIPGSKVRESVLEALARARGPLGEVEDAPGGGFRLKDARGLRSIVVGGLHEALRKRVFAEGVEHVGDGGPSTREEGKRIHRHVYHLVECLMYGRGRKCTCGSRFRSEKTASKAAQEVVRVVKTLGLHLVASEVGLVSTEWELATRADLVCGDADGRVVLISLKTGACKTGKTERTLRGGLEHMYDTEHARHQVQLAAEREILHAAGVAVEKAYVIYSRPGGDAGSTSVVPLDKRLWNDEGRAALDKLMRAGDDASK